MLRSITLGCFLIVLLCAVQPAAALADCHCYWDSDCKVKFTDKPVCNWFNNLTQENDCNWKKPKRADATEEISQCSQDDGDQGQTGAGGDCDGLCEAKAPGSQNCVPEPRDSMAEAIQIWGDACITVAGTGGGLISPTLAQQATEATQEPDCGHELGRHIGSLLNMLGGGGPAGDLFIHPVGEHDFEGHSIRDLSDAPCLVSGLNLVVDALANEVITPNGSNAILDDLPGLCPQIFNDAETCAAAGDPLSCVRLAVQDLAAYLGGQPRRVPSMSTNGALLLGVLLLAGLLLLLRRGTMP